MASCSLYLNKLLIQKFKFRQKKRWSQAQRHAVQPNDSRQGENRKMAVSRYLDELLIQKCQFRGHFEMPSLSLEKLSSKGSCNLDESSMNHTLAQEHFANSDVECILRAKTLQLNLTGAIEWSEVRNVWLALDNAVKYDVSHSCDLNAPRSDTAGTEVCVQTSIQLISIASLAWLGNQPSHPLQLKRRLDKRLVKYSKLLPCNGKEPDKKKQFRQSR